jgi:purine nucleosidase
MDFPAISHETRLRQLQPPAGRVRVVVDTDTYNEIDDQFAVVYSLLSPDELEVEAIYAAPFHNQRSTGPADGMEKSYEEILRLLDRLGISHEDLAFKGSTGFLSDLEHPYCSEAALDLVERVMTAEDEPLYVVAIGAITNLASAILIEPGIIGRTVVVWLGGQPFHWPTARHFNLQQDPCASRLILDCGVPLVHVPCDGVASHLLTTLPDLESHIKGRGAIGDYLLGIFRDYTSDHFGYAKEIWDISCVGYLIDHTWVPSEITHSPVLTDELTWSVDNTRHLIRNAVFVRRNPIFEDLFRKLDSYAG